MNDVDIQTSNNTKKKSITFEALKSIATSIGATFGLDALLGNIKRENLKSETRRAGILAALLGTFNIYNAMKHNQQVESHALRLEQERATSTDNSQQQR